MAQDTTSEVVARLRSDAAQLLRMSQATSFGDDLSVRVKAPDLLISSMLEAAALISSLVAERDSWRRVAERCKSEAEGHSMEARTANSTIYEIYQVLTGATGEPGNWNGAEPARQYVATAETQLAALTKRVGELEGALTGIAEATDPDDPGSYRSDDREGCLDHVHAAARRLTGGEADGKPS
jgi:hypothetical protein